MADFHVSVSYAPKTSRRACASLRQDGLVLASLLQQRDANGCWLSPELRIFDCALQGEQIEGAKQALIELFDIQVKWAGETGKPARKAATLDEVCKVVLLRQVATEAAKQAIEAEETV